MLPGLEILIPAATLPTITIDPTLVSAAGPGVVVVATFPEPLPDERCAKVSHPGAPTNARRMTLAPDQGERQGQENA